MPKPGLRKINRYTNSFKATAVKLALLTGVLKQDVAESLDIHPFMLSRWIKEVREGKIVTKGKKVDLDKNPGLFCISGAGAQPVQDFSCCSGRLQPFGI